MKNLYTHRMKQTETREYLGVVSLYEQWYVSAALWLGNFISGPFG